MPSTPVRVAFASLLLALSACGLASCAGNTVMVNGTEVYEDHWEKALQELRPRVAFDLGCPAEQSQFVLFKRTGRHPSEVGVIGCGKRATYVRNVTSGGVGGVGGGVVRGSIGPWVLNSQVQDDPSAVVSAPQPDAEPPIESWTPVQNSRGAR
jgi:hypothetical protein